MKLAVVGLGKLGLPLALVLSEAGHEVRGYDPNSSIISKISSRHSPIVEALVPELLEKSRLVVEETIGAEFASVEMCFVIVPTPSVDSGAFTNRFVTEAVVAIGEQFRKAGHRPVVVIVSTVMPGSCAGDITAALEAASGETVGEGIGLCYSPEFIALGSVVHDLRHPDVVLIGESDRRSGNELEDVIASYTDVDVAVCHMPLVDAEVAKIAVNTYVTMKISFANELAEICEGLPGADARIVAGAVARDRRIGSRYLRPATAYGGPCFPRDTAAFATLARETGATGALADATHVVNRHQIVRLADVVRRRLVKGGRIGILGLSYKPQTPIFEASAGVSLLAELLYTGELEQPVLVYDPATTVLSNFPQVEHALRAQDVLDDCDLVVITTAWPQFVELNYDSRAAVIDCWDLVDDHVNVSRLGVA